LNTVLENIEVKSLYLTKYHAMKTYGGVEVWLLRNLNHVCRSRWVLSVTPWPLYPTEKSPWYPFDRLFGPQSQSWHCGEERQCLSLPGIESLNLVTVPTDSLCCIYLKKMPWGFC